MMKLKNFDNFLNEVTITRDVTPEQARFLNNCTMGDWKPTSNGMINVDGNVNMSMDENITEIPVKFSVVSGNFNCSKCPKLKTLKGSPDRVGGDFVAYNCHGLKSLEGAPEVVVGYFQCSESNSLLSLEGAPKSAGGFYVYGCESLKSLKGSPRVRKGDFSCDELPHLDKTEAEIVYNEKLKGEWIESGLQIREFIQRRRGQIKGSKFGI